MWVSRAEEGTPSLCNNIMKVNIVVTVNFYCSILYSDRLPCLHASIVYKELPASKIAGSGDWTFSKHEAMSI